MVLIPIVLLGLLAWWITETLHLEWWMGVLFYLIVPIPVMALVAKAIERRQLLAYASTEAKAALILESGSREPHAVWIQKAYVEAAAAGRTGDGEKMLELLELIRQEAEQGGYSDVASAASAARDGMSGGDERASESGIKRLTRAIYKLK